jgi:hypothetical protein
MALFNVWHPMQHGKTTVTARDAQEARDRFCQRWGYADEAHYTACTKLSMSNLKSEAVGTFRSNQHAINHGGKLA